MSESFNAALEKVDLGKYINQIQEELKRAVSDIGPGKSPQEVEAIQARLQDLFRRQSKELAREVGFLGNQVMVFMTATAIIATAWVSFVLRRETSDLSKAPEDRLATIEMLDALDLVFEKVVQSGIAYADKYGEGASKATSAPEPGPSS